MKALVLAAGYGTRLYPLTTLTSKSLLTISGKPLVEHILMRIEELQGIEGLQGIKEIIIVTNNRFFPDFRNWLNSYGSGVKVRLINDMTNSNEDKLGAVGDIHFAVRSEGLDDDLLVIAGDNLFEFSLLGMYRFFREKRASVVALHDLKDPGRAAGKFGIAEIDSDFRIVGFEEKPANPKSSLASTACYLFTKKDLAELERCIAAHQKPDNLGDFVKWLSAKTSIYGFVFGEKWFDVGSHEHLKEADAHFSGRKQK